MSIELILTCWRDEQFKQAFIADPYPVLKQYNVTVGKGMKVRVLECTSAITYVVLPAADTQAAVQDFIKRMTAKASQGDAILPDNHELRIVQNSASWQYFVLPAVKSEVNETLTEAELEKVVGGGMFVSGAIESIFDANNSWCPAI